MAKYASQPTLPTSPAFGAQPNNFSTFSRYRAGQPFPSITGGVGATGAGAAGNPYATGPQTSVGQPATAQGMAQFAQQHKVATELYGLVTGGSPGYRDEAPGRGAAVGGTGMLGLPPGVADVVAGVAAPVTGYVGPNNWEKFAREHAQALFHSDAAAPRIDDPSILKSARSLMKLAGMPMGAAGAAPPPPPMPTPLGVQGMLPPGATPPGGPGAAPPPGAPAGAPMPADPNAPPAAGAMPPGDPAAAGGAPPPTLNGEVPPMGMPPTPPLPANPRVNPPRQATPQDFQRRQDLNQLLQMDEQASPENTVESMQPDLLAMGSKSAFEMFYEKCAASPLHDPVLHARVDAMGPQVRNVFDRFQNVFEQIWEKCAAQDNGPDQHAVQRSATGESKGLSYQHKPDHYMQGQDAWDSVSGYFKGGEKKKPNPFIGKHASCGDELAFKRFKALGHDDAEADRLAGLPLAEQEKAAGIFQQQDSIHNKLKRLRNRRQPPADQKQEIGSSLTQFKYAGEAARRDGESRDDWFARLALPQELFKEAAMPYLGKSSMPVVKPGFALKETPPAAPYNPAAGILKPKREGLSLLKLPSPPPKPKVPKTAADMEKIALVGPALQSALRIGGATAKGAYRAAKPSLASLKNPMVQKHIGTSAVKSLGGGFAAGATGDGSSRVGYGDFSVPFDWNRAAMGAMAFNPTLNKLGRRGGNWQAPLFNSVRGDVAGSFAGMAGDTLAGWTGLDTGGIGQRWGSRLGTAAGAARGVGQFGQTLPQTAKQLGVKLPSALTGQTAQQAFTKLRSGATRAMKPVAEFGNATDDALVSALTYLPRQVGYGMRRFAPEGGRLAQTLDAFHMPTQTGAVPGMVSFFNKPTKNLSGYLGRTTGALATGVGGAAMGYNMLHDDAQQTIGNGVVEGGGDLYEALRPQMAADVANVMDTYLNDAGLMGEDGKARLPKFNLKEQLGGLGDELFTRIGLDPATMSPAQKLAILGGTGILGAGALTGSAPAMGLGGALAGGGLMRGGDNSPLMQLLKHLPRNEYRTQLEQTGQVPNGNPYGQHGPSL